MKLADFLRKVAEQGKIVDTDFNALMTASALAELEVPDVVGTKFDEAFLTRERAENDPDIIKKIKNTSKAEVLDGVDEQLKVFIDLLPKEKADEISKNRNTFERITALGAAVKDFTEGSKSKVDKDIQKVEEEWAKKLKFAKDEAAQQVATLKKENQNNALKFVLKNKILSHEFADAYKGLKEDLAEIVITKVKNSQIKGTPIVLDLDESGSVNVRHEVEGTLRDIYDGQEKVTLDKLLTPALDPFIKKSTGNGQGTNGEPTNGPKKIPTPTNPNPTLREQMLAQAANS